jgi:ATP-dependent DNA helicase 2 subunit 2
MQHSNSISNATLAISSIVVAIQMITVHCKHLKYKRKIVLVTNGRGLMNIDGIDEIVKKIRLDNIELVILCASKPHMQAQVSNFF